MSLAITLAVTIEAYLNIAALKQHSVLITLVPMTNVKHNDFQWQPVTFTTAHCRIPPWSTLWPDVFTVQSFMSGSSRSCHHVAWQTVTNIQKHFVFSLQQHRWKQYAPDVCLWECMAS